MKRLGIDLGASAVKLALLDEENVILNHAYRLHHGNPLAVLEKLLLEIQEEWFPAQQTTADDVYVLNSGMEGGVLSLPLAGDIVALTEGARRIAPSAAAVIAIGGQSARYITGLHDETPQFAENDSCASGTGAFFENQMARLGLPLAEYSALVEQAKSIPRIAGRCSVFAKTDIIHCQNEGVSTPDILLGLCYASIRSYKAIVAGKLKAKKPVLLSGGVGYNTGIVRAIREIFELAEDELLLPDGFDCVQAIGAAALANTQGVLLSFQELIGLCKKAGVKNQAHEVPTLPPLSAPPSAENLHQVRPYMQGESCYLGIDIGSTSTNLVLIGEDEQVIETIYLRTKGDPKQAVREGFTMLCKKYGYNIPIKAASTTGSGRMLIGKLIGADTVKDEITAQATAALRFRPGADTVFEIGGQDSKYISLRSGRTDNFQMNKICAAGTGSFIEEQAAKLDIPLEQYGDMALSADAPADLGERCTVFIESRVAALLAQGTSRNNIAAGLCYSIVNNYLNRVVGTRPIGNHILLQGGVAYNPGIVAAFKRAFGSRISIAPYFSVSGAVGAALLAKREIGAKPSAFKGLMFDGWNETLSAKSAASEKQQYEPLDSLDALCFPREPGKKTIGIPRVMFNYDFFPVLNRFFHTLGYNVLLSPVSSDETVELGQTNIKEEVCYPLKLAVGHAASLVQQRVDYIFMPSVHGKGICVYMQKAPQMLEACLALKEKGIGLLTADICMDTPQSIGTAYTTLAKQLGRGGFAAMKAAWGSGMSDMTNPMKGHKAQQLPTLPAGEIGFVLVSRSYGLSDPVLSLSIKQKLNSLGYTVYDFPRKNFYSGLSGFQGFSGARDFSQTQGFAGFRQGTGFSGASDVYWPFGKEVLTAAKQIRDIPNLYPIYLTYHGCGPDTMLTHWFENEIGGKPYLAIEVDEHASHIGIITRLEAFANSLSGRRTNRANVAVKVSALNDAIVRADPGAVSGQIPNGIPNLYPYSALLTAFLKQRGYQAEEMMPTTRESLAKGRALMRGKECFSQTALLGDCLEYARTRNQAQILIPQNKGAENDGLYARFIAAKLREKNYNNVTIIAPMWERLIKDRATADALFAISLAGDILLCASASKQAELFLEMKAAFSSGYPAEKDFVQWAQSAKGDTKANYILCAGEYTCYLNPLFRNELEAHSTKGGYTLRYAPLSELLLLEMMENGRRRKVKEALLRKVSSVLYVGSPFAESIAALSKSADFVIGSRAEWNGRCLGCTMNCSERICQCRTLSAGGRWRAGKTAIVPEGYHGLIRTASMYENTASVLNLTDDTLGAKRLELRFEGTLSAAETARVETWLHYLA
ncbi:acyl-CoA dehydratase activase [Treponema primitia]|uniref:acyl-CoA dehydratase activase n=1 Tax=Treponema primitia TaxID=88058 RepID=UPI00398046CF